MTNYHWACIALAVIMFAPMIAYETYHSKKERPNDEKR